MTDFRESLDAATSLLSRTATDGLNALLARQYETGDGAADGWMVVPEASDLWWIAAKDSEAERRAREATRAFLAPDIAEFDNATRFEVHAPVGALLDANGYVRFVRIRVLQPSLFAEYLALLVTVRLGQPPSTRISEVSVAFLLRDFYLALEAADFLTARALLDRVAETGVLRGENLRFLEVELLARSGRWHDIRQLRWFSELGDSPRPTPISTHLLETLWRTEGLADLVGGPEEVTLPERFASSGLADRFGNLFRTSGIPTSIAASRLLALWLFTNDDASRTARLLDSADDHEREVLRRLVGQVRSAPTAERPWADPDVLQGLLDDARYDELVNLAEGHPESERAVAMAVRAAAASLDAELCRRVCTLVDNHPHREMLARPGLERALAEVRLGAQQVCASWEEWLERIAVGGDWRGAAEAARSKGEDWSLEPLLDPTTGDRMAGQLLEAVGGPNAAELRGALASLCSLAARAAQRGGSPDFIAAVLLILAEEPGASPVLLDSVSSLVSSIVNSGPAPSLYDSTIEAVKKCWERCESANYFDWFLDLIDGLGAAPIPLGSEYQRAELLSIATRYTFELGHRLLADQESLLRQLVAEQGLDFPVAPAPKADNGVDQSETSWLALAGKTVLLYSLLNGMGERFRRRLTDLCADVTVDYRSDTHCTDQLQQAVVRADIVVVDVHHALHSATGCIDAVLAPRHQIRPNGRGVSAFIRELGDTLRSGPAAV